MQTTPEHSPNAILSPVCPVQLMADGLQHLAISAALGRSPRQLNIAPPPARPDLHGLLSKASTDARPFTRRD